VYRLSYAHGLRESASQQLSLPNVTVMQAGVGTCWSFIGALALILGVHVDKLWYDVVSLLTYDVSLLNAMLLLRLRLHLPPFGAVVFRDTFLLGELGVSPPLIAHVAKLLEVRIVIIHLV
jgi:hypothetical protein